MFVDSVAVDVDILVVRNPEIVPEMTSLVNLSGDVRRLWDGSHSDDRFARVCAVLADRHRRPLVSAFWSDGARRSRGFDATTQQRLVSFA